MATAENEPVTCNQSVHVAFRRLQKIAIHRATIRMDMAQKLLLSEKPYYTQYTFINNITLI